MNKVLLTLETLLLRQDKLVNNGYFLANIGEKIADRLPKFVEIAGGFLAVTLAVCGLAVGWEGRKRRREERIMLSLTRREET